MNSFELNSRLAKDCHVLGKLKFSRVLLMNNALVPWFILVPETTKQEITDLPPALQTELLEEINQLSAFIKAHFEVSKLNTAAIGNIVSQLHIHIVGRTPDDYCWPNVVWGNGKRKPYTRTQVNVITSALDSKVETFFANQQDRRLST